MAQNGKQLETEIKLRIANADAGRQLVEGHGFNVLRKRVFERNSVYDTSDGTLRRRRELLRVRRSGDDGLLTFKAAEVPGRHKQREELETGVAAPAVLEQVLERLGLSVAFRYEKYRTEFQREPEQGIVTLDETPIGTFLELEGSGEWIDTTARELGFQESDYILSSYAALYFEHCRINGLHPGHMVFESSVLDL